MPSPIHILETALLFLAAFLIGCVVGYLARRLMQRRPSQPAATTATAAASAAAAAPLVTAPTIAPLPAGRRPTAAERLAAAAGRSPLDDDAPKPEAASAVAAAATVAALASDQPAEAPAAEGVASEATAAPPQNASVIVLPPPEKVELPLAVLVADDAPANVAAGSIAVPPVEAEPPDMPVAASDVPPIDEAAHVVEGRSADALADASAPPLEPPAPIAVEQTAEPVAPAATPPESAADLEPEPAAVSAESAAPEPSAPPTRTALEDPEAAAMRAIEGNWTPRRANRVTHRPVLHPEAAIPLTEVEGAMANARSAVESAAAAAAAAIAEAQERPRRPAEPGLSFDQRSEEFARSFLAEATDAVAVADTGLQFEPDHAAAPQHQSFGRPEALAAPRGGGPDNLKQIKGITPSLEASLHGLGIYHFDQIAAWDQKAVVWIDNHLSLRGRIGKEKWLDQARDLSGARGSAMRPMRR